MSTEDGAASDLTRDQLLARLEHDKLYRRDLETRLRDARNDLDWVEDECTAWGATTPGPTRARLLEALANARQHAFLEGRRQGFEAGVKVGRDETSTGDPT